MRDKLIYYVQQLLIFNQFQSAKDLKNSLAILNKENLEEIIEERASLKLCCNLSCQNKVSQELVDKFTKRNYQILKNGSFEKIEQHIIFCDKVKSRVESQCELQYQKLKSQIENDNEFGPFSSTFQDVIAFLQDYASQELPVKDDSSFLDRDKIKESVQSFQKELSRLANPIKEKENQNAVRNQSQSSSSSSQRIQEKEETKAQANFKVNIVSNRQKPEEVKQISLPVEKIENDSDIQQNKKKSVRFQETQMLEKEIDEEEEEFQEQQLSQNEDQSQSSTNDNAFEFEDIHEELEKYRLEEMSPFQKIHDLFLNLSNDSLIYYLLGKKNYEESDSFLQTSTRDFFLRQIKIQLESLLSQKHVKTYIKDVINMELSRLTYLMDINQLVGSFTKDEWRSIAIICLKLIEKRLINSKGEDYAKDAHKNRRIQLQKKKKKLGENIQPNEGTEYSSVQTEKRTKESLAKFLSTISPEAKKLKTKISQYGSDANSTQEVLAYYVKTCNDQALYLIKQNEFRVATEILHECEYLLLSPIGQGRPDYKYQTFNNLAHAHNLQGNVRLSLKYLLRAVEYGEQVIEQNQQPFFQKGQANLTIVESYLNACNAYSFLNQNELALEYAEKSILLSHKLINELIALLDNPQNSPDEREYFGEQYHSQINLHSMGFHTKGQIYEKLKRYEEAIVEYQSGKQVVEANYGPSHKLYVDFANSINGAKLRIKYYQHSNLPQDKIKKRKNSKQVSEVSRESSNLFMIEQERIKPISQQKGLKKLRPASAKQLPQNKDISYSSLSNSQRKTNNISNLDIRSQRIVTLGASLSKMKNRSVKRMNFNPSDMYQKQRNTPPLSVRSTSSSNADQKQYYTSQRQRLQSKMRRFQESSHSKSRTHHAECEDCHRQLEEIRQLHIEQQKMMNLLIQQSVTMNQISPQRNMQSPGTNVFNPQASQSFNSTGFQQQMMPPYHMYPPPYYYPYPPPPMPYGYMPPHPAQMGNSFQQSYQQPTGIFLPPQRPANQGPLMNNFMSGQTPDKLGQFQNQDQSQHPWGDHLSVSSEFKHDFKYSPFSDQNAGNNFNNPSHYPHNKQHPTEEKYNQNLQQNSIHTDLNDRESHLDFDNEMRGSKTQEQFNFYAQVQEKQGQNNNKENDKSKQNLYYDIKVENNKKQQQKVAGDKEKPIDKMKWAAIKIQRYYRAFKCYRVFKEILNKRRQKQQFYRQIYLYLNGLVEKRCLLVTSLISLLNHTKSGALKHIPSMISIDIFDHIEKKIIYEVTVDLKDFGFRDLENVPQSEIFTQVKNIMNNLKLNGDPQRELLKDLHSLIKNHSVRQPSKSVIFVEPSYFDEGLVQVKQHTKIVEEDQISENIDESIQDEYSFQSESLSQDKIKESQVTKSLSFSKSSDKSPQPKIQQGVPPPQQQPIKIITKAQIIEQEKVEDDYENSFDKESIKESSNNKSQASYSQSSNHSFEVVEEQSPKKPQKVKKHSKLERQKATLIIQTKARQFLAKKQVEIKRQKKTKLAQFVLIISSNKVAQITLIEKFKKKKQTYTYKLVVKNQNKKHKNNSHKIKIEKLPQIPPYALGNFYKRALEITWKGETIQKVSLNPNSVDIKQLLKENKNINMHTNDTSIEEKESSLSVQSLINEDSIIELQEEVEKQSFKVHTNKMSRKEYRQKIIKAQALIRGHLVRKQFRMKLQKDGEFRMLQRLAKKLSDGNLYFIFLLGKALTQLESADDTLYLITLREVANINEVFDLNISLKMIQHIFSKRPNNKQVNSTDQLNTLITFETNKAEFNLLLQCLDIIDDEISFDFAKFQSYLGKKSQLNFEENKSIKDDLQSPAKSRPQSSNAKSKVQYTKSPTNSDLSSFKEEVIEEADSKFEVSPQILQNQKKAALPPPKQQSVPQPKKEIPPSNITEKKKKKIKVIDLRTMAIIKIQSHARRYLTLKRLEKMNINSFKNKSIDPAKHLKLFKQGIFRACGLYFMYMIYADEFKEFAKFTLKELSKKTTVISLKKIVFADFGDGGVDIDDMPGYIEDSIQDSAENIMIDPDTNELREDWLLLLHEYIENEM